MAQNEVLAGIDMVMCDADAARVLTGKRLGLITNPTGVTRSLEATLDVLHRDGRFQLVAAFGPEHGLRGEVQDAIGIGDFRDESTGLPVYSLYGASRQPTAEMLAGIDALVFDIQDVGSRFYTYISTMLLSMRACASHGREFIVLDRPNPISGSLVEGNILDERFTSFVGACPIPARHGLTVGELAIWANEKLGIGCKLTVCEMRGWTRSMWADETGLPWVMPSPNLPSLETATVYPGTCFVEGTNVSEGRGTTRPFELVGAPWVDGQALARRLNALGLSGCRFRPVFFVPSFSKYAGEVCAGVQVHVLDRAAFEPVRIGVYILAAIRGLWPDRFQWVGTPEQSSVGRLHIDLLAGTDELRRTIDSGGDIEGLLERWDLDAARFGAERVCFLLY
ncbi:MAG: DUF1343 domain-containing protein [Bacillota bacterium]|nr:DUF1343 domain-containing protein [Bacillota bacterium]